MVINYDQEQERRQKRANTLQGAIVNPLIPDVTILESGKLKGFSEVKLTLLQKIFLSACMGGGLIFIAKLLLDAEN